MNMSNERVVWNTLQKELKAIIAKPEHHELVIERILVQHSAVHSACITGPDVWSFEDEVLDELSEENFRRVPKPGVNSIAWHIYHSTRIEDITLNTLVGDRPQVFDEQDWSARIGIRYRDTGNGMKDEDVRELSAAVHIASLRDYRNAVGLRTREIVMALRPGELKQKIDPSRVALIKSNNDVREEGEWLLDYWGGLNKAGIILMPATRHLIVHLNKSQRLKK
ncbi:DinB family protein [Fontibacillus phaseoli]|uniref:DinB family protein n=1 Tax=Fontibacillus phaseoli TaxID=1416533 RepID=A0A369BDR8_9BACL|nr:DinB family protein [Fontibacillus phaseoli]RCX19712.1 DinB family protein [Fontibacillus phaseoli]